jgi:hypothetical protein
MGFKVSTATGIQLVVFCAAELCIMFAVCQRFGGTHWLHLQDLLNMFMAHAHMRFRRNKLTMNEL